MKSFCFVVGVLTSSLAQSQTFNHNVYVHQAGIDPNIIMEGSKKLSETQNRNNQIFSELGKQIAESKNRKKNQERKASYTKDLIQSTDGLKNLSAETILPLIDKYPEFSDDLLDMLKADKSKVKTDGGVLSDDLSEHRIILKQE